MHKLKVLYIQVPAGGGSLIALYEMLKHVDKTKVEPVVLSYHKNQYTAMLEAVSAVVYLPKHFNEKNRDAESKSSLKVFAVIHQQLLLLKDYYISSKPVRAALLRIINQLKPAIIHHNNEIFLNRDAVREGIKAKLPQIVHERSLGNYGYNYVNKMLDRMLMRKVKQRIDITKAVTSHFNKLYTGTENKSTVLHDIVDVRKFTTPVNVDALKSSFAISSGTKAIVSVGRIIRWKGLHILIEAIALLKDKLTDYKVLIAGPDDEGIGSPEYKAFLQNIIQQYGLQDNIIFTGNRDDIADIIQLADVVVHCAVKPEPQGLVIIEALLGKKPVIASGNAGSGELIEKYGGIALEPVTAVNLAAKLEALLVTKSVTSPCNYKKLIADFDASKQMETLMKLYSSVE